MPCSGRMAQFLLSFGVPELTGHPFMKIVAAPRFARPDADLMIVLAASEDLLGPLFATQCGHVFHQAESQLADTISRFSEFWVFPLTPVDESQSVREIGHRGGLIAGHRWVLKTNLDILR